MKRLILYSPLIIMMLFNFFASIYSKNLTSFIISIILIVFFYFFYTKNTNK